MDTTLMPGYEPFANIKLQPEHESNFDMWFYPKKNTDVSAYPQADVDRDGAAHVMGSASDTKDASRPEPSQGPPQPAKTPCLTCSRLATSLQRHISEREKKDEIGIYGDFKHNEKCTTCQLVVDRLELDVKDGFVFQDNDKVQLQFAESSRTWYLTFKRHSVNLVEAKNSIDDELIDLKLLRTWIEVCDNEHSGLCHSVLDPWRKIEFAPDLLLIDVEQQCLVQRLGSCRYSALSYVWGKPTLGGTEPFQTKLNNHIELRQRGAFARSSIHSRIPETIKDSMLLTKKMNIQYLWCDRFCIIQDDPVTKPAQLKSMAAIYANAHITIAACEGEDDKFGLPGINRTRSRPFTKFDFAPTSRMVSLEPTRSLSRQDAQYHTRGWIFQEWTLSPRILAFHHHTVSWVCRRINQQEHGAKVPPYVVSEDLDKNSLVSEQANVETYAEMVMQYSSRDLTYQGDSFFAFSAIITAMGRSMRGGILFGLPEMIFDGALLWMIRGVGTHKIDGNGKRLPFPSWSWVAWNGGIDTFYWRRPYEDKSPGAEFPVTIHPVITWYKVSASTGARAQVYNTYYEIAQSSTKVAKSGSDLPLVSQPQTPIQEGWSTVLFFQTTRVYLRVGQSVEGVSPKREPYIEDADGNVVGLLECTAMEAQPIGQKIELICIGRMETPWTMWTGSFMAESQALHLGCSENCWRADEVCKLGKNKMYRVCNVLWVDWEDGVAYRRALGRVFEQFWDEAETETIDVHLG